MSEVTLLLTARNDIGGGQLRNARNQITIARRFQRLRCYLPVDRNQRILRSERERKREREREREIT